MATFVYDYETKWHTGQNMISFSIHFPTVNLIKKKNSQFEGSFTVTHLF